MSAAIPITRLDHTASELRGVASKCGDGAQVRRLLAIALDGRSRAEAAGLNGMDRQTLSDWVHCYTPTPRKPEKSLANQSARDSCRGMIRPGFLDPESRKDLIELARDGSVAHRLARRANALLLLDGGMSCEAVGKVLFIDDDTVRTWYQHYQEDGIEGLANFGHESLPLRKRGAATAG